MKKSLLFVILISQFSFSQSILGKWKTIDEKTQKVLSVVEFYEKDNVYFCKLVEIINVLSSHADCEKCSAKIKNKSLLGKNIIVDLIKHSDKFTGRLIDPFSDKSYNCSIKFISKSAIEVNAYYFLPIFGRKEIWIKINEKE